MQTCTAASEVAVKPITSSRPSSKRCSSNSVCGERALEAHADDGVGVGEVDGVKVLV